MWMDVVLSGLPLVKIFRTLSDILNECAYIAVKYGLPLIYIVYVFMYVHICVYYNYLTKEK